MKMHRAARPFLPCILCLFLVLTPSASRAGEGSQAFTFVDAHYIITAEAATQHSFVLNFINLSDFVIVVQPNEFIYKGASGRFYIGQVYESEHKDTKGETQRYSASVLLKGHSFTGLNVVGAFREQDGIVELSVRIGAKRFYLEPLQKASFDQLAAKIGGLDLKNPSPSEALEDANIAAMGKIRSTDGTSEWDRDWEGLITPEGVNPPKIIEKPEATLTPEARRNRIFGKVRLAAVINKSGGIQDIKVVKSLGRGLDERAMAVVKGSWVFLPATRNGEVLDSSISFDVDFPAPAKGNADP